MGDVQLSLMSGFMPESMAATSVNVLNDEPICRFVEVAKLYSLAL